MIIVLFIFIISFVFVNRYKTKRYLHMLQQNLYNENNRYLKWIKKNIETTIVNVSVLGIAFSMVLFYLNVESFIKLVKIE